MQKNVSNYDLQMESARELFLGYDQEALIRKFSLDADENWLYLTYLNTPTRISRSTGRVEQRYENWTPWEDFNTVMTIYDLLCYCQGSYAPALLGQWCAVGNFIVTGITETETFTRKFARLFDGREAELRAACVKLGGELLPRMAGADVTCKLPVTPFFPVLLQFWAGDEDFPPRIMLLWDRNTDKFLHFETTFYLQGDILARLAGYF